jgi:hypothetical protein
MKAGPVSGVNRLGDFAYLPMYIFIYVIFVLNQVY